MGKTVFEMCYDGVNKKSIRDTNVAPIELSSTASKVYSIGDRFVLHSDAKLYVVTQNISEGGTITPGTNCVTSDTFDKLVKDLNSDISAIWSANAKTGVHQLIDTSLAEIKASNTMGGGVWNGNTFTYRNASFTVNADLSITVHKEGDLPSSKPYFYVKRYTQSSKPPFEGWNVRLSGCPATDINNDYDLRITKGDGTNAIIDAGSGSEAFVSQMPVSGNSDIYLTIRDISADKTFKPLICLASDTSNDFTLNAMTNQQLTDVIPSGATPSNKLATASDVASRVDWDSYAKTGVHNLCPMRNRTGESFGIIYTENSKEGIVTANGSVASENNSYCNIWSRSDDDFILPVGNYKVSCDFTTQSGVSFIVSSTRNGSSYTFGTITDPSDEVDMEITPDDIAIGMTIRVKGAATVTNKTFKPLIKFASDTDNSFTPYAMTNLELTQGKVDNSVVGTVENGATASQAYAVGGHFIKDGKFCTCISAISSGGTFTKNTNYVEGTIADNILKVVTFSGNTNANGNLNLYFPKINGKICSIVSDDDNTILFPFIASGSDYWYVHATNTTLTVKTETAISGRYYYI